MKRCSTCGTYKPLSEFQKNRSAPDGLQYVCKSCTSFYGKRYYQTNKAKVQARHNNYWKTNKARLNQYQRNAYDKEYNTLRKRKDRARRPLVYQTRRRLRGSRSQPIAFRSEDWKYALRYFDGCCAVCGRPPGLWHSIAMDHWIPLSSPDCPGTIPTNIVPLCHGLDGCNNSKCNRNAEEWLVERYGAIKAKKILHRIQAYFAHIKSQ